MQIGSIGSFAPSQAMRDKMFARIDNNSDGKLSLDEFKAGSPKGDAAKGPGAPTAAQTEKMFKTFDSDGDGSLTQQEMDAGMDAIGQKLKAAMAQHATGDSTSLVDMPFGEKDATSGDSRATDDSSTDATSKTQQQRQVQWILDAFVSQQKVAAASAYNS